MVILSEIDTIKYFKELPFSNKPIGKPKIKRSAGINLLTELPFYQQLSVTKLN